MPTTHNMYSLAAAGLATIVVARFALARFSPLSRVKGEKEQPEKEKEQAESSDVTSDDSRIVDKNAVLIALSKVSGKGWDELSKDFCGTLVTDISRIPSLIQKTVYLCGDLGQAEGLKLEAAERVLAIRELSYGFGDSMPWPLINVGAVPILVHGVGVLYRRFFEPGVNFFHKISTEHTFQALTESTKPGTAHRTGIYLTPVEQDGEDLNFRLLRCSTNLSGPTANFAAHDLLIVGALNEEAARIFENQAPLNHVLAQIYINTPAKDGEKERKAKIKAHADKTKDMPRNGLMAFCTFYDHLERLQPLAKDPFDWGNKKGVSGLTKLYFRLKDPVAQRPGCRLKPQFSVTLYPDSVFFMPLSTNRLYTHEIRPCALGVDLAPTRLGYVVRCSETEAVHRNGQTFLKAAGALVPLQKPTKEGMEELRKKYTEENTLDSIVHYPPTLFSMNEGDYSAPALSDAVGAEKEGGREVGGGFRVVQLSPKVNIFQELRASVQWENVGKGRLGAVLVLPSAERGTPIVRTTTQYAAPAQCFQPVHTALVAEIEAAAGLPAGALNNVLVECYTNEYTKMGFHSDQALDLAADSNIAVFSCYSDPLDASATPPRKLVVESKEPGGPSFEVPLAHNSVVTWSLDTNRRFRHKIVLDDKAARRHPASNEWLGLTLRSSKTFVRVGDDGARFEGGSALILADAGQRQHFFALRGRENAEVDFAYPPLPFSISESDLVPPALAGTVA